MTMTNSGTTITAIPYRRSGVSADRRILGADYLVGGALPSRRYVQFPARNFFAPWRP